MSTPDESFPTVQPSKPRGGRFRFSLRAMLLTIALVCLVASHFYTSWQLQQARDEVRELRQEVGRLTIDDPSRLHAVALKDLEERIWRWRVYLPEGRDFWLNVTLNGRIPREGLPSRESQRKMSAGEYVLTVAIRKDQDGKWFLHEQSPQSSGRSSITEDRIQWLVGPDCSIASTTAGTRETESAVPGKPLVLLRARAMKRMGNGATENDKPTDGIMIWIDEGDPNE